MCNSNRCNVLWQKEELAEEEEEREQGVTMSQRIH